MKANVGSFEEPEPDTAMTLSARLRKPIPSIHNLSLPPIIKPSSQRDFKRRKTV